MATVTERARGDGVRPDAARSVRSAALPPAALVGGTPRRHWGRVAAGALLVLVGGWVTASLFSSAGDRVEVLVVARDVGVNETIERNDLASALVAADGEVDTVRATDLDEILGRIAATNLVPGSLLAPDHVREAGEAVIGPDEAAVGLLLSPGDAPLTRLAAGAPVGVVVRPADGAATGGANATEVEVVDGWLLDVSAPAQNGDRPVSVVVPDTDAGLVSSAAAEDRVSLAVREG